ncbi:MAG: hypothetical protein AAF622_16100, partial [Cyanobacteria bacterium P01_C01_bin.147]
QNCLVENRLFNQSRLDKSTNRIRSEIIQQYTGTVNQQEILLSADIFDYTTISSIPDFQQPKANKLRLSSVFSSRKN